MSKKLFSVLSIFIVLSMILAACATPTAEKIVETVEVVKTQIVEVQGTPQVVVVTPTAGPTEPAAPAKEFKSKDPTTYVEATFGEPETLDPALDYESAGIGVILQVYDTLIYYNYTDANSFVPQLATEVPSLENGGISADGTTYTFKIRPGVKFHDGSDMTVDDVAYTFQRNLLQGGTASPQWLLTEPFLGVGVYDITDVFTDTVLKPIGVETLNDDPASLAKVPADVLKATCEKVTSAIVADASAGTVTFKLAQPWAPFIPTLANGWGGIMSKAWTAANGGWDGDCATWQNFYGKTSDEINKTKIGTGAMGTGPYMLDHWTPSEEIVLKANDNYWRSEPAWEGGPTGAPKIKTVIIKTVDEFSTRYAMLQAGDADYAAPGSQADWPQMDNLTGQVCDKTDQKCEPSATPDQPLEMIKGYPTATRTDFFFTFVMDTTGGNNFIGSGQLDGNGVPPDFFSDIHVRRAFAYCFDYDTYLNDVLLSEADRSHNVMLPGMVGYQDDYPVFEYDPAKCEEEFKLADVNKNGKAAGEDPEDVWDMGFRLTIAYNTGNTARQTMAQIFQNTLSAVNEKFVVEVTGLPWPTYLKNQRAKKLPIFPVGWIEDIHETHNWVQPYAIGTYGNRQNIPDDLRAKFSELIDKGVVETDPAKRAEIYHEFNKVYQDAVTGLILFIGRGRHYQQRWVEGWFPNPIAPDYYYALWKN